MWGCLALALTIGLAGCADDKPPAAPEPTPPPKTEPPKPDPLDASARKVRIHAVNATGSTSTGDVREAVEFNLDRYEKCYEELLSRAPDACGSLELVLSYHRHGTWGHSGGSTFDDEEFSRCIPYQLGFPSPSLAKPGTTYSFVLVFAPEPSRFGDCAPAP